MHESVQDEKQFTNKLAGESSPYLLSHAHNPVDWYPWGEEALKRARDLDRPIFLSIGYAACHWCHVMERESFEDEEVARVLNEHFVSIKVDREQRPDLDHIYMAFTTALTGSGGWPMTVFLTPDLKPFYAGTYFPPQQAYGRPGFMQLITEIAKVYGENKEQIISSSESIFSQVSGHLNADGKEAELNRRMIADGARGLMLSFDQTYGGFGNDRKFPHALELSLFLRHYRQSGDESYLQAAEKALTAMAYGGIHDHVGGGFARYSVDRMWLIPHFEKMLYDNSLLVPSYVEAYQLTGNKLYLDIVRSTLDFMLKELSDPSGGLYSSLDADSEGEEGKFYAWSKSEIESVLGDDAKWFMLYYNVTEDGNFEGKNVLNIDTESSRVEERSRIEDWDEYLNSCKKRLFEARAKRVRPGTDDKILTSWNGLALSALTRGYQITGEQKYLAAAIKNATFVRKALFVDDKLTHAYRQGVSSEGQFLEDYAYYVRGLLDLYESDTTGDNHQWLEFAVALSDNAIELFQDDNGTFYLRDGNQPDLIVRPRDEADGALPAPGSIMMGNLMKLHRITDNNSYLASGEKGLKAVSDQLARQGGSMASAIFALDYYLSDKLEIVLVGEGDERGRMIEELYNRFLPNRVIAISATGNNDQPLFKGRQADKGEVLAYVCRNSACQLPVSTVQDLQKQLDSNL